jgi:putative tryptophan/tyrosine transport system substrate-binding protein
LHRRHVLVALATFVAVWPCSALPQRSAIPFIGYLSSGSPNEREQMLVSFRRGLKEGGYVDGQDVAIEYRWAEGRFDRLPDLAADLVKRKVAVIATSGGASSALAAKAATKTIPIVFLSAADPIKLGLVPSLSRPGGNVTGVTSLPLSLESKRLQTMRELLPGATRVAVLVNPKSPTAQVEIQEIESAALSMGTQIIVVNAASPREFETAFAAIKNERANALFVVTDAMFTTQREHLVELAERYAIPASYSRREFAIEGGLMSYGPDYADVYRQHGAQTARVLKGAKPAELPVIQAGKLELVFNLKTAKKLGLAISRDFLTRADEVIE